jgi:hypothetical protein
MAKIIFNSTVKGNLKDLDVKINDTLDTPVNSNGVYSIVYTADTSVFKVIYELKGQNGTNYSIDYRCICDGKDKSDPNKNSPISGTIKSGNFKTETINIIL